MVSSRVIEPSSFKVLVIDDSDLNRAVLKHHLTQAGYEAICCESAVEGLATLKAQEIDLVLLDVIMPEMDGFEALQRMRKLRSMSELPIMMITALNNSQDVIKALELGANDYITKPLDTSVALARIRTQFSHLEAERALRESQERYALAALGANDGLWDWDLKSNHVYYSTRWKAIVGFTDEQIKAVSSEWFKRVHPDDYSRVKLEIDRHLKGLTKQFSTEYRILHKDGHYVWVYCRGIALRDSENHPYRMAGSQSDITHHGMHDALTGLPKRSLLLQTLKRASSRQDAQSYAVHLIDIWSFKTINDNFGFEAGDRVLAEIAKRLMQCLPSQDTLARVEGDAFAVLQSQVEQESAARELAHKLQSVCSARMMVDGQEVSLESNVGFTIDRRFEREPEELLRDAYTALVASKRMGSGSVCAFDDRMHSNVLERFRLENELRRAVERNQFELYYQPKIDLRSGTLVSMEALLRWFHPELGSVPPRVFIPIAEECGLIHSIGDWVLDRACQQVIAWQKSGLPKISVAINLSPRQFVQFDLLSKIKAVLDKSGLDASYLELEITESTLMENMRTATDTLEKLHELGVSVAIDDFGTGYSSLSYLKRFKIDCLKIDKSFVYELPGNLDDAAITSAIVAMAHKLQLKVVAEGVENMDQVHFLSELKCEEAQGFHFSRPLDPQGMMKLLEAKAASVNAFPATNNPVPGFHDVADVVDPPIVNKVERIGSVKQGDIS